MAIWPERRDLTAVSNSPAAYFQRVQYLTVVLSKEVDWGSVGYIVGANQNTSAIEVIERWCFLGNAKPQIPSSVAVCA
jgi:hypothetical protein